MDALIAGGGIAGLACAHAFAHWAPDTFSRLALWERAPEFEEVGAGVQLGPNATRLLEQWGLGVALAQVAFTPQNLSIYATTHNHLTARRNLGAETVAQYGAPSYTIHRADLQQLLLESVRRTGYAQLRKGCTVQRIDGLAPESRLRVHANGSLSVPTVQLFDAVFACDGGFSTVREQVLGDGSPQPTGQVAYRALLPISDVKNPALLQGVSVWMGANMHVVAYPVRGGTLYNLVVIVQGAKHALREGWNLRPVVEQLPLPGEIRNRDLAALLEAVSHWRYWVLCDRAPLSGAHAMVPHEKVALVGDAAHPMLPFLAQGAAMAIEDAHVLAQALGAVNRANWREALKRYGYARWRRNGRVQAGARRNSHIFHFAGPMAWARDAALKLAAPRLLDIPWLYAGPPSSQN